MAKTGRNKFQMKSKSFDDHLLSSVFFKSVLKTCSLVSWTCILNVIFLIKKMNYTRSIVFPGKLTGKVNYR